MPPPIPARDALRWLADHEGRHALARPLVALVPLPAEVAEGVRTTRGRPRGPRADGGSPRPLDVVLQGRRVFANWRELATVASDDAARPVEEVLAPLLPASGGDDAFDLVAFGSAAARLHALGARAPALARAHHVMLVTARAGTGAGLRRWLSAEPEEPAAPGSLFPGRPGRPPAPPRLRRVVPRVRTLCAIRPARLECALVMVCTRWRDEPADPLPPMPRTSARWSRFHTAIALATAFAQLVEVEAGSPAALRA